MSVAVFGFIWPPPPHHCIVWHEWVRLCLVLSGRLPHTIALFCMSVAVFSFIWPPPSHHCIVLYECGCVWFYLATSPTPLHCLAWVGQTVFGFIWPPPPHHCIVWHEWSDYVWFYLAASLTPLHCFVWVWLCLVLSGHLPHTIALFCMSVAVFGFIWPPPPHHCIIWHEWVRLCLVLSGHLPHTIALFGMSGSDCVWFYLAASPTPLHCFVWVWLCLVLSGHLPHTIALFGMSGSDCVWFYLATSPTPLHCLAWVGQTVFGFIWPPPPHHCIIWHEWVRLCLVLSGRLPYTIALFCMSVAVFGFIWPPPPHHCIVLYECGCVWFYLATSPTPLHCFVWVWLCLVLSGHLPHTIALFCMSVAVFGFIWPPPPHHCIVLYECGCVWFYLAPAPSPSQCLTVVGVMPDLGSFNLLNVMFFFG